ncbi:MAG: phosphoglycerate mutase family protein, partial [Gemmatimonadota bacterium]
APGTAPAPDGNAAAGAPAARAPAAVLFLLRHAETLTSTSGEGRPDPSLSETGRARAQALARALGAAGVTAVWSSAYRRTQETAAPLAAALGLDVEPYDASRLNEVADALAGGEGRIVVVGHSNTTPRLVELLGGDPGEPIDERTEYDRLYVLIRDGAGEVTTVRLHYGPG